MCLQVEALKLDDSLLSKSNNISNLRTKYQYYFRKASVLFISITLFSFLLSYFTGISFLYSYTYYSSKFLLPYLTQTFERKYMFLLCNGILVFLAGRSGLHKASCNLPSELQTKVAETDIHIREKIMNVEEDLMLHPAESFHPLSEEEAEISIGDELLKIQAEAAAATVAENEPVLIEADHQVVDLVEDGAQLDEGIEMENKEESGSNILEGEEDDTESEGPASNTEELNKKIEEFIRKMKEELQLEAQQQQIIAA
ncbi:uncharacterized protein LOC110731218 [Chenopodium quinoa]|uniref:uncharacterized protein LOC110731218 n=1 Tax=Chenopodium quinoa TaxID=63459 RepID=UPI000B78FD35|nr:uncharacterized protein LOC110731218 [Chenopodium quinoa]